MPVITPVFPIVGGVGGCNAVFFDSEHFLDLFDRLYPFNYIGAMQATLGGGYEVFEAFSYIGERGSEAIEVFECGSFAIFAEGGAKATGTVLLKRDTATAGALTVLAGTIVTTTEGGLRFVTTADVAFGALDLEMEASIEAEATGYEWNVRGQRETATGETLEGSITIMDRLVTEPPYADPTIYVEQVDDTSGGRAPMLDGLGEDRGIVRSTFESDDQYRLRIRSLPDTVSPDAIVRAVTAYLAPYGLDFNFIETFEITYQTCWDAPSSNLGTPTYQATAPTNPDYDENLFAYDDERTLWPLNNVWLDECEYRGAFIVQVERATIYDVGMAYDDPGMGPSDFRNTTTDFQRGTPAYDVPNTVDPDLVYPAAYDGFDLAMAALLSGLIELLEGIKPAGVAAIVELERS